MTQSVASPNVDARESEVSTASPAVRFALWGALVLVLAGAFFAWALTWKTGVVAGPLPVGQPIPDFSLTERSGKIVTKGDLLGKVWVADFVFTRCSGPCPELSARFQRLQMQFQDQPDLQLVTFSLDPLVDTASVLHDYANRFHADANRWWFLTTDKESAMHDLVKSGFFQTVVPASDGKELIHSAYLVLVDRKGRIRGAYLGTDNENQPQLIADAKKLLSEPGYMIELSDLPAVNATLNSIAFVLLVTGRSLIRRGNIRAHKRCMISAFVVSAVFLVTYLTYRFLGDEKKFGGVGWIRPVYFFILITHISLAITVPILGTWTLVLGLKNRIDKHRRLARITYPIWVYVSITGVIVYVMLFRLYGPAH